MTGISYNTIGGIIIGPTTTTNGIFGNVTSTGTTCTTLEVNTSTLSPAGPYSTTVNRPVAIRMAANGAVQVLSLCIGFTAAY